MLCAIAQPPSPPVSYLPQRSPNVQVYCVKFKEFNKLHLLWPVLLHINHFLSLVVEVSILFLLLGTCANGRTN